MFLTVKEMEVLCIFHAGTISATLASLRKSAESKATKQYRMGDVKNLIEKLSGMKDGEAVSLAFEPEN